MLAGRKKLYFLLDTIRDIKELTPTGKPIPILTRRDLRNNFYEDEIINLLIKLEKEEKVIKVLEMPNPNQGYIMNANGTYIIELLPSFDNYYSKIQDELEYQGFTGKKPTPK